MSPIYIMFQWMEHRWSVVAYTVIVAMMLSILSLLFMDFPTQFSFTQMFYLLFHQVTTMAYVFLSLFQQTILYLIYGIKYFRGPNNKTLSPIAKQGSGIVSFLLLLGLFDLYSIMERRRIFKVFKWCLCRIVRDNTYLYL